MTIHYDFFFRREGTERPERGGHHDENARTGPVSGGNQINQVKPGRDSTTTAMQGSNFPNETIIEEFKVVSISARFKICTLNAQGF